MGTVMPIDKTVPPMEVRAPTEDEKKFQAYKQEKPLRLQNKC